MLSKTKLRNSRGQSPWLLMFILHPSAKTGYPLFDCSGGSFCGRGMPQLGMRS
ncbi:MAG: hypothetical protein IKB57_02755 [Bacteroidaceae bacterium]|nr:hypothetical protein [Bacteroidaceae bacterium]